MELTKNKAFTAKDARDVAMSVNGKGANDGREIGYYVVHSTGSTAEGQVVQQIDVGIEGSNTGTLIDGDISVSVPSIVPKEDTLQIVSLLLTFKTSEEKTIINNLNYQNYEN